MRHSASADAFDSKVSKSRKEKHKERKERKAKEKEKEKEKEVENGQSPKRHARRPSLFAKWIPLKRKDAPKKKPTFQHFKRQSSSLGLKSN